MIPDIKSDTTYAVHLRAPSVSGGKDWVGSVTAQGEIHTYWGRTGAISHHAGKPGDIAALNKIISQKRLGKDSYVLIDEYTPQQGWLSLRKQHVAHADPEWSSEAPESSIKWDF